MKLNMKTMIIAGAVVGAMALEAVVMLVLMPSSSKPAAGDTSEESVEESLTESSSSAYAEEPIDEFKCTNNQEESIIHLRFKVVAVVKDREKVTFREIRDLRKSRIRQAVEKIVRRASRDTLNNDPDLNTLKRQIREEINKILEHDYVFEAVIHDFSMIEQ